MGPGSRISRFAVLGAVVALGCASADSRRAPRRDKDAAACEGGGCADGSPLPVPDARPPLPEGDIPPIGADSGPTRPDGSSSSRDSGTPPARDAADSGEPDDAGPVCGNRVVEEGEQCDDGNPDGGDGCEPDCTRSRCITNADCDDRLYCNGVEACTAGRCTPGVAPSVDDGVPCTVDDCDESTDAARHVPDDSACDALDGALRCLTAAGHVVRDEGVCVAPTGCAAVTTVVEDCTDDALYPTTFSCAATGPAGITRHEGTCTRGSQSCSYTDVPDSDCSSAIPSPHPFCSGTAAAQNLAHHFGAQPTCSGGTDPVCGYTESATACGPGNPACARAALTTYRPTCTAAGGCGRAANPATACPDSPDACATNAAGALVHTTFTPACASPTACGAATPTPTTCVPPSPVCASGRLTTRTATCTAANGCGVSGPATTTCPVGAPRCVAAAPAPTLRTFSPACNAGGTACASPGTPTDTPCPVSPTTCAAATLSRHTPTCAAGACGETTVTSPCPDSPDVCVAPAGAAAQLTTYTPRCNRVGTACLAPAPTTTPCPTPAPACTGRTGLVYTTYRPTCNATSTSCSQMVAAQTSCAMNAVVCNQATGNLDTVRGTCTAAAGCGTAVTPNTQICSFGCDPSTNTCWVPIP